MLNDELGGMHLPDLSAPAPPHVLNLASAEFAHVKHHLPGDAAAAAAAAPVEPSPAHGVKHKHPSSPGRGSTFTALSAIDDDTHHDKRARRVPWTNTEDMSILALHRHLGTNWEAIAAQLPGRTADAVRNRCFRLEKQHPMANSDEGTHALDGLVLATHGIEPPATVDAAAQPTMVVAAPRGGSDHGRHAWTAEEDKIIEEGVQRLGCKWREIAKFLPGRTDSSIRNRWMRLQKERFTARTDTPPSSPNKRAPPPAAVAPPLAPAAIDVTASAVDVTDGSAAPPPIAIGTSPPGPVRQRSADVPLGHDSPYVMVDLDAFAALAFDASAELPLDADGPSLKETTSIRSLASDELEAIAAEGLESLSREESANRRQHEAAAAAADAAAGSSSGAPAPPPIERSKTPVAPSVKLASAFFATFAALTIGTLTRGKRS